LRPFDQLLIDLAIAHLFRPLNCGFLSESSSECGRTENRSITGRDTPMERASDRYCN
jgi:hypothetical protein